VSNRTIQFHATPTELASLVEDIVRALRPRIIATEFPPLRKFEVQPDVLAEKMSDPRLAALAFVVDGQRQPYTDEVAAESILLQISRPTNDTLRQSAIGIRSRRPKTLQAWNTVARQVRSMTRAGVTATDPKTGESATYKDFRFTKGAEVLSRQGTVMLPGAGTAVVTFDGSD
jgi:hypothetical protein